MTKLKTLVAAALVLGGSSVAASALPGFDGNNDPIIPSYVQEPAYRPYASGPASGAYAQ